MPRKAYVADLDLASKQSRFGNISNVKPGADDGEFVFLYHNNGSTVQISALIPDPSDYPKHHAIHVFAAASAPATVARALDGAPSFSALSVVAFLNGLSTYLDCELDGLGVVASYDADGDMEIPDSQPEDGVEEELEGSDNESVDNQDWILGDDEFEAGQSTNDEIPNPASDANASSARARADLRALKEAGFKAGIIGSLSPGSAVYLSLSCRIRKLGISEEAMEAWRVDPSHYLILLMYYPHGYRPLEYFEALDFSLSRSTLDMQVGVSNTYKVTSATEAQNALKKQPIKTTCLDGYSKSDSTTDKTAKFREIFISRPLTALLTERFFMILKYRLTVGLSWTGSEKFFDDCLTNSRESYDRLNDFDLPDDSPPDLPRIVSSDAIATHNAQDRLSLPLVAMQFLLRHFVRCPEFCLVCHRKLETQLEAIKPYVCDKPLCLFQYMNLGFGPSIEHEVLTQPYVVDLLVSFCYTAAACKRLGSYPEGLGLSVPYQEIQLLPNLVMAPGPGGPQVPLRRTENDPPAKRVKTGANPAVLKEYECRLDQTNHELLFDAEDHPRCPLKKGDWIVIDSLSLGCQWHCKVLETILFPSVKIGTPVFSPIVAMTTVTAPVTSSTESKRTAIAPVNDRGKDLPQWVEVSLSAYDQNFDELQPEVMCDAITKLLGLLPSVHEMRDYLARAPGTTLSEWTERISPACLGLLRWIIASNRSCIEQVDLPQGMGIEHMKKRAEDRVQGVPSWLQFRFAMGAPDKEQRFLNAIASRSENALYPTLFAWHGSPLRNWHSIIRQGLHFQRTDHGRAYGHGCYHAKDFNTSISYCHSQHPGTGSAGPLAWPKSVLQVTSAVALSEIVNSPGDFVSQNPYFVVAKLDWIQTRYLFVLPAATDITMESEKELCNVLEQDPHRTPCGPNGRRIVLPSTAVAKSRRPAKSTVTQPKAATTLSQAIKTRPNKEKLTLAELNSNSHSDDLVDWDQESVETEAEDLEILFEPTGKEAVSFPNNSAPQQQQSFVTDFIAGRLPDLPLMPVPRYATSIASKRLQKDFRSLLATQESHIQKDTLQELGWYLDHEHLTQTDNLYQWLVALHSFPLSLPLATDMKSASIRSIILEIRFHATYPFSPPFVRVVRPRFLPFHNGGGGHVTAGGSICMDLLTSSGWSAAHDIESVLLQIRMAIMSTDPRPARLLGVGPTKSRANSGDYGVGEAVDAFKRAARSHGWVIPEGLDEVAAGL